MKNILILISIFFCVSAYAQEVQIIERNDNYTPKEKVEKFEFIDKNLNLTNQEKLVVLKGYCVNAGKNTLISLFNTFWEMSNKQGANSYFIDNVDRVSDTIYVQISAYCLDDSVLNDNFKLYSKNMVYVFGDMDVKKGNTKKIKLNGQKVELAALEYVESQNEVGKYVTVSIGGFLGAKVSIYGKEDRLPEYLSLNGFGIGPGNFNQISIRFNTGRIYPVKMNLGQFLISILTKKNEMSCEFAPHKLNETQKFQFLRENMDTNIMAVARWCREMGDWLSANHYDKVF
ncbi:MAG: hypothetical protein LBS69_04245 [Prevotellaceae bacterium]|jgi:hypothetical protein|nr:hypothetical protein [Prevotellaceae bacterium]